MEVGAGRLVDEAKERRHNVDETVAGDEPVQTSSFELEEEKSCRGVDTDS